MTSRPSTPRTHTILTPAASARSNSSCSPSLAFRSSCAAHRTGAGQTVAGDQSGLGRVDLLARLRHDLRGGR